MTRDEFFNRLWEMVKDTNVDFYELLDGDGEGGIYVQFTNIQEEEEEEEEEAMQTTIENLSANT